MKLKLNEEKFKVFAESKINKCMCPLCQSNPTNWGYNGKIMALFEYTENFNKGNEFLPLIDLMCQNCGYTILINAKTNDLCDIEEDNNAV